MKFLLDASKKMMRCVMNLLECTEWMEDEPNWREFAEA